MTDRTHDIVIVGGGLAAGKAAETLRAKGFDDHLTLITAEPHRPYERPPLSKDVLVGEKPADTVYVHPEAFYAEHDIDLITGDPATELDRDTGTITTKSGVRLAFDRLLLATGADPRQLPLTDRDLVDLLELGDVPATDVVGAEHARLARRLEQPLHIRDSALGRDAGPPRRPLRAGGVGGRAGPEALPPCPDPHGEMFYWVQRYWLVLERDAAEADLTGLLDVYLDLADEHPQVPAWRAKVALLHSAWRS